MGSAHNLAVAIIRLSLTASGQQRGRSGYAHAVLLGADVLRDFDTAVGGGFRDLTEFEEDSDINGERDLFGSSKDEAAGEHLGHQRFNPRLPKRDHPLKDYFPAR